MVIAVTYQEGQVFQHFGHSEFFKLYQVEGHAVVSARVTGTQGAGHGALAGFLREQWAEVPFCGCIGAWDRTGLDVCGIRLYPGVTGEADQAVAQLLAGQLRYDPDTTCHHHHHGEGHSCGEHPQD